MFFQSPVSYINSLFAACDCFSVLSVQFAIDMMSSSGPSGSGPGKGLGRGEEGRKEGY